MYQRLDPAKIVATLEQLERRVNERFPGAGLGRVGAELIVVARQTQQRAEEIARPDWRLRLLVGVLLALGAGLLVALSLNILEGAKADNELFGTLQGIDSAFNIIVLMGAALFFMVTLEERLKRNRALKALHELRSIIHVVDMHQLTKDPGMKAHVTPPTPSSPPRLLGKPELIRYLDYCSEMLSLAAKVAVLYAQSFPDPVVTEAVNDLERTATSLSQKIWQKINILHRQIEFNGGHAAPTRPPPLV
ncbi:MAG: hypothetical protein ACT4N2_10685 [Hyphomicrobium sp.]